ncbi:hypothetical protein [Kamptonema sp. UHCC 0994]|nr:hypothetical protein [Kamptonema sp. UHCC 0994]MDF0555142.1 hypothetical protein [Kamptonema sp. UHCC 0994]
MILGNYVGWRSIVVLTTFELLAMTSTIHTLPPVFIPCRAIAESIP